MRINHRHPEEPIPIWMAVLVILPVALFVAYGPRLVLFASWVRIRHDGIAQQQGKRRQALLFRDVSEYEWIRNTEYGFWTLSLHRTSGSPFLVGVPDTTLRDEIEVVLQQASLKRVA